MFGADNCVRSGIHDGAVLLDPPPPFRLLASARNVFSPVPAEDQDQSLQRTRGRPYLLLESGQVGQHHLELLPLPGPVVAGDLQQLVERRLAPAHEHVHCVLRLETTHVKTSSDDLETVLLYTGGCHNRWDKEFS